MEATVTLKGTPREFDITRKALASFAQECNAQASDTSEDANVRRAARAEAAQALDVLAGMGGAR